MSLILSTCWYIFKAKFDENVYAKWMHNMLSNVNNYYLVIYTDENSQQYVRYYADNNPRILVIIKPIEEFYGYKYQNKWIENHVKNFSLNTMTDWKVNMLWSEKIHFVCQTIEKSYFAKECENTNCWYGWCDIGYFRGRHCDMTINELTMWPSERRLNELNPEKIYYGRVNNDSEYMKGLMIVIQNKNEKGLPANPIPPHQISIAGGFFLLKKENADWWRNTYDERLQLYFENEYVVKDDQMIIIDCIFSNLKYFTLLSEVNTNYDNWFMFQRLLCQ